MATKNRLESGVSLTTCRPACVRGVPETKLSQVESRQVDNLQADKELLKFPARWIDGESIYVQDTSVQNIDWLNKHLEVKRTPFGSLYYLTNILDGHRYRVYFITPKKELNETFIISWHGNAVSGARAVLIRNF